MKRMTTLAALLLALAVICACALPWGLPSAQGEDGPARQADGSVLAVENRRFTSRIYTLENGVISGVYEESRLRAGQDSRIARVAADGEQSYFLRGLDDDTHWELVRLNRGRAETLDRGLFENPVTITGLQVRSGTVWITALGDNEAIFIYRWTEQDGISLALLIPAWWLRETVTAEYDGSQVRATTSFEDTAFISQRGSVTYSPDAAETPGPELVAAGMGWLRCKQTPLTMALLIWAFVVATVLITRQICRRAARLSVQLAAVGSAALLLTLLTAGVVIFLSVTGGLAQTWQITLRSGITLLAAWIIATALLWLAARRITAPIAALTQQMDQVAEGNTTAREPSAGEDELSQMDRSMQLLCMNLSVMAYETAGTIRSYRRFVPEKMTDLLERPVVEEIRLGDSRRMVGNVGVFSVGNRTEVRNTLEDGAFMDFINHSFGVFYDSLAENNGCMVSSGLRLSAMEALFPVCAADGVQAGLDFLGRLCPRDTNAIPVPKACLLLHKASFLYGIAGQEDRLFPHLSSSELDFLASFLPEFDRAGVRIVVTEAYWKQLEGCGFSARYIGFVSGEDRQGSYKLYEVLDAYPELERDLRTGYDSRFQEALNLFYRNDFYLARNLFSMLLRACPGDGIARWYLFACESLFHQEGGAEPDYRLFGLKA